MGIVRFLVGSPGSSPSERQNLGVLVEAGVGDLAVRKGHLVRIRTLVPDQPAPRRREQIREVISTPDDLVLARVAHQPEDFWSWTLGIPGLPCKPSAVATDLRAVGHVHPIGWISQTKIKPALRSFREQVFSFPLPDFPAVPLGIEFHKIADVRLLFFDSWT